MNRITPRGWTVLWILAVVTLYAITSAMGIWDIPESCLVDQIDCPAGYQR